MPTTAKQIQRTTSRRHHGPRTWRADLSMDEVLWRFSPAAAAELRATLDACPDRQPESLRPPASGLAFVRRDIEALRTRLENGRGFAIADPPPDAANLWERRCLTWLVGSLLGEPLAQNDQGATIINVYQRDRRGRIADGARYHQTREGGSIHTDNVNLPERWHYLVMGCLAPALVGGETILVSGAAVYNLLLDQAPEAVAILCEDFLWDQRGFGESCYRAPVLTFGDRGEPRFRYLRSYLEAAHARQNQPLDDRQLWALDTLDSALELGELQFRAKLGAGQIVVILDDAVLHGRTSFSDHRARVPYDQSTTPVPGQVYARTIDRLWIRKNSSPSVAAP